MDRIIYQNTRFVVRLDRITNEVYFKDDDSNYILTKPVQELILNLVNELNFYKERG